MISRRGMFMVYIERSITPYVQKAEKNFKAVLITGDRQAGKSTLLKNSRRILVFLNMS